MKKAKIAIASYFKRGPGVCKRHFYLIFLQISICNFVEEFGLLGGVFVVGLYLFLLVRVLVISQKAESKHDWAITCFGLEFLIIFQSMINMAVASTKNFN